MTPTKADYDRVFEAEQANRDRYPAVDAIEARNGYKLPVERYETAARFLACPYKLNPPNWQHGRVIYAICRNMQDADERLANTIFLDIGTAKGFSALCMAWAVSASGSPRGIVSIDIVDPSTRVLRNSVREADGSLLSVHEFVEDFWPAHVPKAFLGGGSEAYFRHRLGRRDAARIAFAFVDGKHTLDMVRNEGHWIAQGQRAGDAILFDDAQIAPVCQGIEAFAKTHPYAIEFIQLTPTANRTYALAVRQ